jgi:hypothetical protein
LPGVREAEPPRSRPARPGVGSKPVAAVKRLGALDADLRVWIEHDDEPACTLERAPANGSELAELLFEHDLRQLVIDPALHARLGIAERVRLISDSAKPPTPDAFFDPAVSQCRGAQVGRGGAEGWVLLTVREGARYDPRSIYCPALDGDLRKALRDRPALEVLHALCRARDALGGYLLEVTCTSTALKIMTAKHKTPTRWVKGWAEEYGPKPSVMPGFVTDAQAEIGLAWPQPGDEHTIPDPAEFPWWSAFDRNADFLVACTSLPVGFGELVRVTDATAITKLNGDRHTRGRKPSVELAGGVTYRPGDPGFFLADLCNPFPGTPSPFGPAGVQWHTSPEIDLAFEMVRAGTMEPFEILEAYLYERVEREALKYFYEKLRDARYALAPQIAAGLSGAGLADIIIKAMYAGATGGGLKHEGVRGRDAATWRPDLRLHIHARARCIGWRQIVWKAGLRPVAARVDEYWIQTCHEDWRDAAEVWDGDAHPGEKPPVDRLKVSRTLGHYKHRGTIAAADGAAALAEGGLGGLSQLTKAARSGAAGAASAV